MKIYDSQSPGSPNGVDACEHYLHSGQQVIETRQDDLEGGEAPVADSIEPTYQNVWSPRYIDSLILRDADEQRVFYLADANYNVTALIGEVEVEPEVFEWQPVERYLYTPYGVVTILDADFTDDADGISDYANTTLYTGREYDPETGLYYYRARYYHAELGKFIARDPIEYADNWNLYCYVRGRPLTHVDPGGTYTFDTEIGKNCESYQQSEINLAVDEIKKTLSARNDCWQLPINQPCACRAQLTQCVLRILNSKLKFQCVQKNPHGNASFGGHCKDAKRGGIARMNPPIPASIDCAACSDDLLAESHVSIEDKWFVPNRMSATHPAFEMRRRFFKGLLMHELLHGCVGPHKNNPRPDAEHLAREYMTRCSTGWVSRIGARTITVLPGRYQPEIVPPGTWSNPATTP